MNLRCDNSMLSTYYQCELKYYLRYQRHRASNESRVSTEVGTSTHAIFDALLSDDHVPDAIIEQTERLKAIQGKEADLAVTLFYSAVSCLIDTYSIVKSSNGATIVFDAPTRQPRWVVKYYQPELPFELPLSEYFPDFTYMGAMDAVVEDGNGHLYILELKTSRQAKNSLWRDKWKMDTQPRGYTWAVSQHTQKIIAGVIIIPIVVGDKDCKMTPEIQLTFTPGEISQWRETTIHSFNAIQAKLKRNNDSFTGNAFLPTGRYSGNCINSTLGRCDYFSYCRSGEREDILMQETNKVIWSPLNKRKVA